LVISNNAGKLDVERQKVWVFLKRGEFLSKKLVPLYSKLNKGETNEGK
jgi:hypothetical protein